MKSVMDRPLLDFQLERLSRCKLSNLIVVATTVNAADEPIAEFAAAQGIACYRGSEMDVLSRYHEAARAHGADTVVRITSDCPLIDPAVVDHVIRQYQAVPLRYDYASNTLHRSYPRGMDTEVFSFAALDQAFREATTAAEHEHVTPFIHRQPGRYKLCSVRYGSDESEQRWTVDTEEDFELIRLMLETLYPANPEFTLEEALAAARARPAWSRINRHVAQKEYGA